MNKILKNQDLIVSEEGRTNWLFYELTEDDFLLGKKPKFSPSAWEDDE